MKALSSGIPLPSHTAASPHWLTRHWLLVCGLLVALYLLFRLPYLLSIPLFNDELFYMLRGSTFPEWLWMSMIAGKFLHENTLGLLLQLPGEPLLISRLFTVVCGLGTLVGVLLLGRALKQTEAGFIAAMLYVGSPNAVLHDRLGIPETMLAAVGCFVLLASVAFACTTHPTRLQAAGVGALIGIANLVKISGLFFTAIPILAVLTLNDRAERWKRLSLLRMSVIVALLCIAVLAPFNYGGAESGRAGLSPVGLVERVGAIGRNVVLVASGLMVYLPGPLLLLPIVMLAMAAAVPTAPRRAIELLLSSSLVISMAYMVIGQSIYPRYLLSVWPLLLLTAAICVVALWQLPASIHLFTRSFCVIVLVASLAWDTYFAFQLMTNPLRAPLIAADRRQYLESWTAGHHIASIMNLLEQEARQHEEIVIVNPQIFGKTLNRLIHLAPQFYLRNNPHVRFALVDITTPDAPQQVQQLATERPTYLLLDEEEYQKLDFARRFPEAERLQVFENPLGTMRFYIYRMQSRGLG